MAEFLSGGLRIEGAADRVQAASMPTQRVATTQGASSMRTKAAAMMKSCMVWVPFGCVAFGARCYAMAAGMRDSRLLAKYPGANTRMAKMMATR